MASLGDARRSGRPPSCTPVQAAAVKAPCLSTTRSQRSATVTVELPGPGRTSRRRWDRRVGIDLDDPTLACRGRDQTLAAPVLDPHHRPVLRPKAARVLHLYNRVWNGKTLSANDYAISANAKASIQARCRCPLPVSRQGPDDARQPRLPPRRRAVPTWPSTTSTRPKSTAGARSRPESHRSWLSSNRL